MNLRTKHRAIAAAVLAAGLFFAAIGTASARGWDNDWRWQRHAYRPYYPPRAYYVPAPPPVYYVPPPVYYAPPAYYAPPPVYYAPRPRYYSSPSVGLQFRF
jgi:hypothetical protein